MNAGQFVVILNSEQPERLIAFYRDVVGLTLDASVEPGAFMVGSSTFVALIVEGHSELHGATKEPERVLLSFMVEDVGAEQARLEGRGVQFIRPATREDVGTFATFEDPDGNYCQLFQLS